MELWLQKQITWPFLSISFFTKKLVNVCEDMSVSKVVDGKITREDITSKCVSPKRTMFSSQVVSNSLHGLQHARLPCLSVSPRVYSNSCPLSQWCHPTISSSVIPFSCCPEYFPASGSFPMSQLFESGHQNTRASASVLPMNIKGWFPPGLISLQLQGILKSLLQYHSSKHQFFSAQSSLWSNSHICIWLLEKP